jgi:hypothetical protein
MFNMGGYCTSPYCIKHPYWTRRHKRRVQNWFSIHDGQLHYHLILHNNTVQ